VEGSSSLTSFGLDSREGGEVLALRFRSESIPGFRTGFPSSKFGMNMGFERKALFSNFEPRLDISPKQPRDSSQSTN
jgi:hypothetical protein